MTMKCPQCGHSGVAQYQRAWRCSACGSSGTLPIQMTPREVYGSLQSELPPKRGQPDQIPAPEQVDHLIDIYLLNAPKPVKTPPYWLAAIPQHPASARQSPAAEEPERRTTLLIAPDGQPKRIVTLNTAAKYGGVGVRAIQKAIQDRKLECEGKGRNRRVVVSSLLKYYPS